MEIRIGCSSWTDPSLVKTKDFYPKKSMSARERLAYYSLFFDTVEVNATFYALPNSKWISNWLEATPQNFLFGVKGYALFTQHPVHLGMVREELLQLLPSDIRASIPANYKERKGMRLTPSKFPKEFFDEALKIFKNELKILLKEGKLGYILFQFPYWWVYKPSRLDYIVSLRESLKEYPVAVEFRHPSWVPFHAKETLKVLEEEKISYVSVDTPRLRRTIPPYLLVTSDFFVVRFHGRNREMWEKSLKRGSHVTVEERYDYQYSRSELEEWARRIERLSNSERAPRRGFLQFNNNFRYYHMMAAMEMQRIFGIGEGWDAYLRRRREDGHSRN